MGSQGNPQRSAEEAARLLASIVESSDDAILSEDLDGIITSWNRSAEHLFGYTEQEAVGQSISFLAPEDRMDETPQILERVRHGDRVHQLRTVRRKKDGTLVPVSISVSPILDANGKITGASKISRDITAQVQAQEELARQQERLRVTLSSIGDAVLTCDTSGRVDYLNPVAEALTGWSSTDAAGQPLETVFRIINEESGQTVDSPVRQVLREGRVLSLANRTVLISRQGRAVPVDDSAAPILNAGGGMMGAVLVFRDITQKRAAEEKLRGLQRQLASELAGMRRLHELGSRLMQHNEQGSLLAEILASAVAISGADKGNIQLLDPQGVLRIEAQQGFLREFLEYFEEGGPGDSACAEALVQLERVIVEDVEQSPVYQGATLKAMRAAQVRAVQSTPMISRTGVLIGMLSTHYKDPHSPSERDLHLIDLLARQGADLIEKHQGEELLRRSEERLARVLEHLPVGVGVVDAGGRVVLANPVWKSLIKGDLPSLDDREAAKWRAVDFAGEPLPRHRFPGPRALCGEEVLPGIDFLHKTDGLERWVRVSALPLRDAHGQVSGALILMQDIEEERRAEERRAELLAKERALDAERALRETEAELARVMRALSVGELATSVAHEINQPLAGVITNAEAALRWLGAENPNVEEVRESLGLIVRDGNRASAVIRRIREFLKKESPQAVSLDLNEVVQEALAFARSELAKRRIAVRTQLARGLPRVRADRIQLQQVLLNLIMNGAEAMAATEGGELLLASRSSGEGGVEVAVRDAGRGMNPQDLPKMFDAFYTTKRDGMGMGLSISRTIVEAHGGRIWAEPNAGPGLTVHFGLPAEAASHTAGGLT